jgi:nitrogen regulatory protein PII
MRPVKRVELVVPAPEVTSLLADLDALGIHDYTAVKGVSGRGGRGQRGDDPFGTFDNTYVLIACEPEEAERVVTLVRPVLSRRGGICLVSDAVWVRH